MSDGDIARKANRLFNLMEPTLLTELCIRDIVRDFEATLRTIGHLECREKFVKGSIEHGNQWTEYDPHELRTYKREEVIDLVNFHAMETYILEAL